MDHTKCTGKKFTHFALVCFADGDARVYGYHPRTKEIYDLPKSFSLEATNENNRLTYVEYGKDKELLLKKAQMARSDYWTNRMPQANN